MQRFTDLKVWQRSHALALKLAEGSKRQSNPDYARFLNLSEGSLAAGAYARFNPAPGVGLGYEDLKTVEAWQFLNSVAEGRPGEPGVRRPLC